MGFFKKKEEKEEFDYLRKYQWRLRDEYQPRKDDEVTAKGYYISMSVDKARRVIDQIRGRSYEETLMILELMPYRACYPIFQLIYSAAANARRNRKFNKANLIISKIEVNKGSTIKKLKPRARGRSYMIKKHTCHITVVVRDIKHFEQYDECLESFSPRELLIVLEAIPKGRRIEMLYGRFLEKHKVKSLFYRTQLIF